MISLPWIALSLVTELVTVALHCPGFPSGLVTELVTEIPPKLTHGKHWLAIMQASVWYLASILSSRSRLNAEPMRPERQPRLHFGRYAFSMVAMARDNRLG